MVEYFDYNSVSKGSSVWIFDFGWIVMGPSLMGFVLEVSSRHVFGLDPFKLKRSQRELTDKQQLKCMFPVQQLIDWFGVHISKTFALKSVKLKQLNI